MEKEITVFIVENKALAKELIQKYFDKENISYAAVFKEVNREKVTQALDAVE